MPGTFAHENLIVYQHAIAFVAWAGTVIESLPEAGAVADQLDYQSASIPLQIAEGFTKSSTGGRDESWQEALSASVQCAAALDVAVAQNTLAHEKAEEGKGQLFSIAGMLADHLDNVAIQAPAQPSPIIKDAMAGEDEQPIKPKNAPHQSGENIPKPKFDASGPEDFSSTIGGTYINPNEF